MVFQRCCIAALCFLLTIIWTRSVDCKRLSTFMGPYTAYLDRVLDCESTDQWRTALRVSHFNPYKPNEKQRLTGNITGLIDIDDNLRLLVSVASRSNNQWKDNAYVFNFPGAGCSAYRANLPDVYRALVKRDPAATTPCIVPAKLYVVNDEPVAWISPNVPILQYGYYRFKVAGWQEKTEKPTVCIIIEAHIIPK